MFTKRDDGRIKFNDTSGINHNNWCKIKQLLNHLGYDFEHEDDVKCYFDRGTWLNLDQSIVVLKVLRGEKPQQLFDTEQIKTDIENAKNHFGLTENYDLAGYILPDGTCLDFSDGQPKRTYDHRQIHEAIENSLPENYGYSQPMIQFMNYGCIRTTGNGVSMSQIPTQEQIHTLGDMIRHYYVFYVDIDNNEGRTVKSMVYNPVTNSSQIIKDIMDYFESLIY